MRYVGKGWTRSVPALIATALLVGCTGAEQEAAASASADDGQMTASVAPVGESGIQGTARITPGADSLTLKLELLGVSEGETYTPSLLRGGCGEGAETVAELDPPHVGTVGVGSSLTRLANDAVAADATYAVAVAGPGGERVACGTFEKGVGG